MTHESKGHRRAEGTALPEYPCTQCGGDAYVGFTDWLGPDGQVIDKAERLCSRCAKERNVSWSFHRRPNVRDVPTSGTNGES